MSRDMGRMGVSPTSSLGLQSLTDQTNARALGVAGAVNQERNNTKLLGMSMRQSAAQFGRNQVGSSFAGDAAALNAGNAAKGTMAGNTAQIAAAGQSAAPLLGAATSATSAAGNLALNQWNAQANAAAQNNAGMGSLFGTIIGAGAKMYAASSGELKEDKQPISDDRVLKGLASIPVEQWRYKEGVVDSGQMPHVGPYAEDMNKQFGDSVAPGGKAIDLISQSGLHHAAIRALEKKVTNLERRLPGLADVLDKSDQEEVGSLPPPLRKDLMSSVIGLGE